MTMGRQAGQRVGGLAGARRAVLVALTFCVFACAPAPQDPRRPASCSPIPPPPRVLRYLPPDAAPGSEPAFGLVLEAIDGIPTRIFNLSKWTRDGGKRPAPAGRKREQLFAGEFALARERWDQYRQTAGRGMAADWERYVDVIAPEELPNSICSPVPLPKEALDGESRIVVAVGLNYREHAEDAGGGDLFLFPKPVRPTGAYRTLHVGDDVRLLDYELELGFVLLDDVDLTAIPLPSELDGMVAYFVANDVSDREPIIRRSGTSGPGTGFVEGKGKPGFMPLGPWMVHGDDLRFLSDDCARSLHMRLSIRESGRVSLRQEAATDAMIAGPREILETVAAKVDVIKPGGNRTEMSVTVDGRERFYPLALVKDGKPILPKGSIVLTGTPGGTALEAPSRFSLVMRALVRFQSPRTRFLEDQVETRDAEGYLGDGDVVIGDIEELGTQWWQVRWGGPPSEPDPCYSGIGRSG